MKIIKDKKLITSEYIKKLHDYILKNQKTFFSKENEATAWQDFDYFSEMNNNNPKVTRRELCMGAEPMLIDKNIDGVHTYCICTVNTNKEASKGRQITSQIPVIEVEKLTYGVWRNGYFLLPKLN